MTLREVFEHYGITQQDLVIHLSLKRQYAWLLWHGGRRLGHRLGKRVSDEFGIPLEVLLYPEGVNDLPPKA
jgi:antitoxin component HigA of HigAB toxin-antitoxin module